MTITFLNSHKKGPGHWKFNVEEYKNQMKERLRELKMQYKEIKDFNLKWDLYKYEIRKLTIIFCKKRKRMVNEDKIEK